MRYTCAIFDLDGTLLNTLDDLKNALNGALAARGYATRTLEEVRMFIGNGVGKLVERAHAQGDGFGGNAAHHRRLSRALRPRPQRRDASLRRHRRAAGAAQGRGGQGGRRFQQIRRRRPAPDARALPGAVRSGAGRVGQRAAQALGGGRGDDSARAQRAREDALYIGDSGVDQQTAQNAGVDFAWVSWGFRREEEMFPLPELRFEDAAALEAFLLEG